MALAAATTWFCRTDGSDTLNGGCFDPSQTAGMNSDGAATVATGNSPVFTSASYNFVAGDVGAWVYVASGTNWTPGWYQITSVASNAATLSAAIGAASNTTRGVNSVAGCATTASPAAATWSIDYSRQAAAQFVYTDLASAGAGNLVSSAAKPFGKQQVGNGLIITGTGTGGFFTLGIYVIASIGALNVATIVGPTAITTGAGVNGTGGLGGALISLAIAAAKKVTSNGAWVKAGTYSITTASTNVAGGCVSWGSASGTSVAPDFISGFNTVPGDYGISLTATKPLLQASGAITTFTLFACGQAYAQIFGIDLDAVSKTGGAGYSQTANRAVIFGCKVSNCTLGITMTGGTGGLIAFCEATNCTTTAAIRMVNGGVIYGCHAHDNAVMGILVNTSGGAAIDCLSVNNSGATSDGFNLTAGASAINCTAYNNGRHGFFDSGASGTTAGMNLVNNIAVNNAGWGYSATGVYIGNLYLNNAGYNNTSGLMDTTNCPRSFGTITLTGSPFTNAGSGDFSMNNTASAGAACRAAGIIGKLLGLTTSTGYADLGAFQHADPAAGGGVSRGRSV